MHTSTSIHILAAREAVFPVVSDLARWPEMLPHYRSVQFLEKLNGRQVVRMAATRSGVPISWVSTFEADPQRLELRFEHLRAWTKGMQVIWTLNSTRDGTRVEIAHDLSFRVPALGWFAEPIIGGFFIEHVAAKTLAEFKRIIEAKAERPTVQPLAGMPS